MILLLFFAVDHQHDDEEDEEFLATTGTNIPIGISILPAVPAGHSNARASRPVGCGRGMLQVQLKQLGRRHD